MYIAPSWHQIALRLILSVIGGAIIGFDRGERGRPAGLRTTMLVCLAASIAMLQTNLLLGVSGKTASSFAVMDLMRLPLGILSGMGFIGAGVILRRGERIQGVTTAATLWFVTVMGLCFGGGQIGLGLAALGLGSGVLMGLRHIEALIHQDRQAVLTIVVARSVSSEQEIRSELLAKGYRIATCSMSTLSKEGMQELTYEIRWRACLTQTEIPELYKSLAQRSDIFKVEWRPSDHSTHA